MSDRIKKNWTVLRSIENTTADHCVDIFCRNDQSYGFEEFRRDSEDMGKWTGINYYSVLRFDSEQAAISDAQDKIQWLR